MCIKSTKEWTRLGSVGIFEKLHVLDDSSLAVVVEFVFNAFLFDEAFPVEFGLSDRVDFAGSVVNGAHDMVEVLVGDFGFPVFEVLMVLFQLQLLT